MAIDNRFQVADGGSGEELPEGTPTSGADAQADYTGHDLYFRDGGVLDPLGFAKKNPEINKVLNGSSDGIPVSGSKAGEGLSNSLDKYGSNDATGYDQVSWALQRQWELDEAERQFNSAEAEKQRSWEKEMSDTAIQRAVSDIKAAGLNPWLALNGGSLGAASTPSGASASASSGSSKVPENYLYKMLAALLSSASSVLSAALR